MIRMGSGMDRIVACILSIPQFLPQSIHPVILFILFGYTAFWVAAPFVGALRRRKACDDPSV
jgi:hypothetical protein